MHLPENYEYNTGSGSRLGAPARRFLQHESNGLSGRKIILEHRMVNATAKNEDTNNARYRDP